MKNKTGESQIIETSFYETTDSVIEEIYDVDRVPEKQFAIYSISDKTVSYSDEIELESGKKITPIQSLVEKGIVLLPSEATEYESEKKLIEEIVSHIHKHVDIHPFYENVIARYLLMTWVFENLSAVPYLRALGEYGTGKTRFIQTIGSLCYKPMFLAGASSDAFLFRVIELFGGTLIINELERVNTDLQSQITIILNNGYERGMPVGRVEGDKKREPKTFDVFCPKIISTRKRFEDQALESRIISVPMRSTTRTDIPPFVSDGFWAEAKELRNKLLMYRFRHLHDLIWNEKENNRKEQLFSVLEPRLKQTLLPLLYVIEDPDLEKQFLEYAKEFQKHLVDVRGQEMTGLVFQKLYELYKESGNNKIAVKDVVNKVNEEVEDDRAKLTSHTIGKIIREELGFKTHKGTSGRYYVTVNDQQVEYLVSRYGIESPLTPPSPLPNSDSKDDLGDSVDLQENLEEIEKQDQSNTGNPQAASPCYICGSTTSWKTKDGSINCVTCHPPNSETDVVEWIGGKNI